MRKIYALIAGNALLISLQGCVGGSPSSASIGPTYVTPGGIYAGTLNNSTTSATDQLVGLIDENGVAVFIDTTQPAIYRFTIGRGGSSFSSPFKGYAGGATTFPNGLQHSDGTVTGTIAPRSSITGSGTPTGGTPSSYSINYDKTAYETPAPFSISNGTYVFQIVTKTTVTVTFTLDTSGNIVGSDTSGCNFTGTATIPVAAYNAYELLVSGSCSGTSFTAAGLAAFTPANGATPAKITLEYDNGIDRAAAGVAIKQ